MPIYGLQLLRGLVMIAGLAVPVVGGIFLAGVTFWFATWWPQIVGLSGSAYYLAAFLTAWSLFPYLWVFELAKFLERADSWLMQITAAIEHTIRNRSL